MLLFMGLRFDILDSRIIRDVCLFKHLRSKFLKRLARKSGFFAVNTVDYLLRIIMYGLNRRYRHN